MRLVGALLCVAACQSEPQPATAKLPADCAQVVTRMREAIAKQMREQPKSLAMAEKMLPAIQRSCDEDNWPASLKACVVAAKPGDMTAMQNCTDALPPELQDKLSKRMLQLTGP